MRAIFIGLAFLLTLCIQCEQGPIGPEGEQGEQGEQGPKGDPGPSGLGLMLVKIGTFNSSLSVTSGWSINFINSSQVNDSAAALLYIRSDATTPWLDANAWNFTIAPSAGFKSISFTCLKNTIKVYDEDHNLNGAQYKIVYLIP